jgi:hypothetical protein
MGQTTRYRDIYGKHGPRTTKTGVPVIGMYQSLAHRLMPRPHHCRPSFYPLPML